MVRPKSKDFTPEEFQKLSKEERQIRGRLSTLSRMLKGREEKISELMKPILKLKKEISDIKSEMDELKDKIENMGFDFPSFRIEEFDLKNKGYYRGVWYVNSKKRQLYLGSEDKVLEKVRKKYPKFDKVSRTEKTELILDVFLKDLQMDYWDKEYKQFKKDS